jgi:hypothetical protein
MLLNFLLTMLNSKNPRQKNLEKTHQEVISIFSTLKATGGTAEVNKFEKENNKQSKQDPESNINTEREESSSKPLSTRYNFSSHKSLPKLPETIQNQMPGEFDPQNELEYLYYQNNYSSSHANFANQNSTFFPHLSYSEFHANSGFQKRAESVSNVATDMYYQDPNGILVHYKKPFLSKKYSLGSPKTKIERPQSSHIPRNSANALLLEAPPKKIFVQGSNINGRKTHY